MIALHKSTSRLKTGRLSVLSKILCAGAAALTAVSFSAPAFAGGGHHGGYYKARHGHHYDHGYAHRHGKHHRSHKYHRGYHKGHKRHYYRGHRHRGGGEAALIALGVIGGAILINEALEKDRRREAYEPRYRPYDPRRDDYYYRRGYESGDYRDYAYEDDYDDGLGRRYEDRKYDDGSYEDDRAPARDDAENHRADPLDEELLGGGDDRLSFSLADVYRQCADEARGAASFDGQIIATPAEPTRVERIGEDQVRIFADLTAQSQRGGQFLRRLTCEADRRGVTFVELT